jgi:signal peptidase I
MRRILTLLVPGYAQARNGHRGKALALAGGLSAAFLAAAATPWLHSLAGLASFLLLFLAAPAWSAIDARRHRAADPGAPAAHLVAVLCLPLLLAAALVVPPTRERIFGVGVYRIPPGHAGMAPTLLGGDRFVADVRATSAERGTLVLFRQDDLVYVKRIVGVAGDVVSGGGDGVFVNGRRVFPAAFEPFGPVTVPPDGAFALSESPAGSRDSRHFGPIGTGAIIGRPLYVLWGGWRRAGTTLR